MNPPGDTWKTYLRTAWWRLAVATGLLVVIWRGTDREQMEYVFFMFAVILLDMVWRQFGGFWRGFWEGWRSK
jgi:hypothetical protein